MVSCLALRSFLPLVVIITSVVSDVFDFSSYVSLYVPVMFANAQEQEEL